jgi:hypothetical protein
MRFQLEPLASETARLSPSDRSYVVASKGLCVLGKLRYIRKLAMPMMSHDDLGYLRSTRFWRDYVTFGTGSIEV